MTRVAAASPAPQAAFSPRWLWLAWLMLPLLATAYQILATHLARGVPTAASDGRWLLALTVRPAFWLLIAVELGSFLCWMRILAVTSLAAAFPLTAISYVLVVASGWLLFGETIGALRLAGTAAILAGAALISLPSQRPPA
jgi:drug/metabolite transporter (DMT)-like permease